MKIPRAVSLITGKLCENGFRADVVGGSVRDVLLGRVPNDYDITTNALPSDTERIFSDFKTVRTGIKHGTLTVIIDSEPYEVTTYRVDGEYTDSRHPDSVTFSNELRDDLARRDFTVNAISYNEELGFFDPFGGREDIEKRIIRAVGDPVRRFSEDALRILRALRFSAALDFDIEEETSRAIFECAQRLSFISRERIFVEWKKLLGGPRAFEVIKKYRSVISSFLPCLKNEAEIDEAEFKSASPELRELMLFASLDDPVLEYKKAMADLKSDNARREQGAAILSGYLMPKESERDIRKMLLALGADIAKLSLMLSSHMKKSDKNLLEVAEGLLRGGITLTARDLKIGGADIVALGIRGEAVGKILSHLLKAVALGDLENTKESLISEVTRIR